MQETVDDRPAGADIHGRPRLAVAAGEVELGDMFSSAAQSRLDYDPQRTTTGLLGSYYSACNRTTSPWPAPAATRVDPVASFVWGNDPLHETPAPGAVPLGQNFWAAWSGFVTVPYSGTWQLGALNVSDGLIVQLGATTVLSDWVGHNGINEFCTGVTSAACNQTLQAGVAYPITIFYYHNTSPAQFQLAAKGPINPDGSYAAGQLNEVGVPAPWLTPPNRALPAGWRLSVPTGASAFTSASITSDGVTLNQANGPAQSYYFVGGNYLPPPGQTASLWWAAETGGNRLKVADGGVTYTFDVGGKLLPAVTGADLSSPTSPAYGFDSTTGQISTVTDPVSGNHLTVTYGTRSGGSDPNCHISAAGFDPDPPVGMVCKVALPDGSTDRLYYTSGEFSRLVTAIPSGWTNPFGGNITDIGYDAQSRLVSIRSPLGSD